MNFTKDFLGNSNFIEHDNFIQNGCTHLEGDGIEVMKGYNDSLRTRLLQAVVNLTGVVVLQMISPVSACLTSLHCPFVVNSSGS